MKKNKRARPARDPQEDEWILAMGNVYVKNALAGLTEHPALGILQSERYGVQHLYDLVIAQDLEVRVGIVGSLQPPVREKGAEIGQLHRR